MQEREYALAMTLGRVKAAKKILLDCAPSGYEQISTTKWRSIVKKLAKWEQRLQKAIDSDDCDPHVWWCPDCDQALIDKDALRVDGAPYCPACDTQLKQIPKEGLGG